MPTQEVDRNYGAIDTGLKLPASSLLFDSGQSAVYITSFDENPDVVHHSAELRLRAFGSDEPWDYGFDDYDTYSKHILLVKPVY